MISPFPELSGIRLQEFVNCLLKLGKEPGFAFPANTGELPIGQPFHYGMPSNFILKYHEMPEKLRLKIGLEKGGQYPLFDERQQVRPEVDLFVLQSELIS